MARGRKKADVTTKEEALPPSDHNGADSDDVRAMTFFSYAKRWQNAKDVLAIVEEEAKERLGKNATRDFRTWASLKDEKGEEKLKAKIEAQMRIARWLNLSVGHQSELFGEDRTPAVDRAYAEGKRDGLAGDPCKPDYAPELEQYQKYMDGFHAGQAVLAKGIAPLEDAHPNLVQYVDSVADDKDLRPPHLVRTEAEREAEVQRPF